jgi:hypothetical protein
MTKERQALLEVLVKIQNQPCNSNRDIMTITGCGMTDQEVRDHIAFEFERAVRCTVQEAEKTNGSTRRRTEQKATAA